MHKATPTRIPLKNGKKKFKTLREPKKKTDIAKP